MALEPSLWGTLPEELLHLVFARLPVAGIGQLRVLSKEWKRSIDCKDSEFNRVFDATTHLKKFALMSWAANDKGICELYDVQADKWHIFEANADYVPVCDPSAADGGLFCSPWKWGNAEGHWHIIVVNPLTRRNMELPPLLSLGAGESDVGVKMVQLNMDKESKEYKLHVLCYMETGGNNRLFAQVYDSHVNGWSVVESREERIIGWEYADCNKVPMLPCVYNCADGNLQRFNPSDIAPGLKVEPDCMELINDRLFVLHEEAPPGSTNLVQDGESNSGKYCISEFYVPEEATAWVKLGVHDCDPSISDFPEVAEDEEPDELTLLACNGFLLVHNREYDRVWLYNLSTCAWRNLPDLFLPRYCNLVMCEINWSALP